MNTGYLIYQAEHTRTAAEQRAVDTTHAELAASLTRLWRSLTAPLRSRRGARRRTQHQLPSCPGPAAPVQPVTGASRAPVAR